MEDVEKALEAPGLSEAKKFQLKRRYSLLRASKVKEVRRMAENVEK